METIPKFQRYFKTQGYFRLGRVSKPISLVRKLQPILQIYSLLPLYKNSVRPILITVTWSNLQRIFSQKKLESIQYSRYLEILVTVKGTPSEKFHEKLGLEVLKFKRFFRINSLVCLAIFQTMKESTISGLQLIFRRWNSIKHFLRTHTFLQQSHNIINWIKLYVPQKTTVHLIKTIIYITYKNQ